MAKKQTNAKKQVTFKEKPGVQKIEARGEKTVWSGTVKQPMLSSFAPPLRSALKKDMPTPQSVQKFTPARPAPLPPSPPPPPQNAPRRPAPLPPHQVGTMAKKQTNAKKHVAFKESPEIREIEARSKKKNWFGAIRQPKRPIIVVPKSSFAPPLKSALKKTTPTSLKTSSPHQVGTMAEKQTNAKKQVTFKENPGVQKIEARGEKTVWFGAANQPMLSSLAAPLRSALKKDMPTPQSVQKFTPARPAPLPPSPPPPPQNAPRRPAPLPPDSAQKPTLARPTSPPPPPPQNAPRRPAPLPPDSAQQPNIITSAATPPRSVPAGSGKVPVRDWKEMLSKYNYEEKPKPGSYLREELMERIARGEPYKKKDNNVRPSAEGTHSQAEGNRRNNSQRNPGSAGRY